MALDGSAATAAAFAELSAGADSGSQPDVTPTPDSTPDSPETTALPATEGQAAEGQDANPASSTGSDEDALPLTGSLPVARHKAILEKERQARTQYEERLKKIEWAEKFAGQDPNEMQERIQALELAEKDPVEFYRRLTAVLQQDPRYAGLFQPVQAPAELRGQQEPPKPDPMPTPDIELEDGRKFYSDTQLQKLMEWRDNRIMQRIAPMEQEREANKVWNEALERNFRILEDARANWEGFKQHEAEIKAEMAKDGRSTVWSAYMRVVPPKLKAERAAMEAEIRKQLLAELNSKASASTEQPGRSTPAAPKSYKGMATSDIVAETFRELAGG